MYSLKKTAVCIHCYTEQYMGGLLQRRKLFRIMYSVAIYRVSTLW